MVQLRPLEAPRWEHKARRFRGTLRHEPEQYPGTAYGLYPGKWVQNGSVNKNFW